MSCSAFISWMKNGLWRSTDLIHARTLTFMDDKSSFSKKLLSYTCFARFACMHSIYIIYLYYSGVQIRWQRLFWAENQGNHQNFDTSLLTYKCWLIFIAMKQKKNFFLKKKIQNGQLKKRSFFKMANSQYLFVKNSWSGPWVSRIHWCEGHWYGSTYMAVRLSDISSKMAKKHKKCTFGLFLSLCRTASRPYRLSHTNALRINEFY